MFWHGRSENRDKHHKTIKAIVQHVAEECNQSRDMKKSTKKMKCTVTSPPTDTGDWDDASTNERSMQKKLVDNHMNCKVLTWMIAIQSVQAPTMNTQAWMDGLSSALAS